MFDQLQQVVDSDPPRLEAQVEGRDSAFTLDFVNFVNICLIKDEQQRPKYKSLLTTPFIKTSETETVDVATYVESVLDRSVFCFKVQWIPLKQPPLYYLQTFC